jgi:hypothetical protein
MEFNVKGVFFRGGSKADEETTNIGGILRKDARTFR